MFPVRLKSRERHADPARLYYLVASNGLFQVRKTATHRSVTRVTNEVPGLYPEREHVDLFFPEVPAELLEDVLAFFDEVYRRYRGEAIVILFYDPNERAYHVGVPPQKISGYRDQQGRWWSDYRLDYGAAPRPRGCVRFGSIHSHAALSAYASHADCEDEKFEDGLHVVFGSFASRELTRSASFVADGHRFHVRTEDVLEGCRVPDRAAPADWMAQVECREEVWVGSGREVDSREH